MNLQLFLRRACYFPYVAGAVAVALVCGPAILSTWQDSLRRTERAARALADAQILASSVRDDLAYGNHDAIKKRIHSWAGDPDLQIAVVLGDQGKPVATFSRDAASWVPTSIRLGVFAQGGDVQAAVPIDIGPRRLGTVYLRDVTLPTWQRVAEYLPIALLALISAILVSVLAIGQFLLLRANTALLDEKEERNRAEQALRRSQKLDAIGQLASTAAHDFNNILAVVQSYLNRIRRSLASNSTDTESYIDSAASALLRAASLSQRFLTLSRSRALNPEPVDLNELVLDLVDFMRQLIDRKIRISTSLEATWLTVCDVGEMENIILNLVINARDAMPDGGELKIATRNVPRPSHGGGGTDHVELRVIDTGIGMSAEVLRRAIEPFFTTKPAGKGTGLGLSAARGYINQANGQLHIESTLGHGTTIIIALPRAQPAVIAKRTAAYANGASAAVVGPLPFVSTNLQATGGTGAYELPCKDVAAVRDLQTPSPPV